MFRHSKNRRDRQCRIKHRPSVEGLEKREVYAVSVTMQGTKLVANITGNDAAQNFDLRASGMSRKLVYNDGLGWRDVLVGGRNVFAGAVTRIEINGSEMANSINLSYINSGAGFNSALENPGNPQIIINCRGGNDTVSGSAFPDRVDGGAGNDHISGNDGNDYLIAGTGRDTVFGGSGDDYIVAMNPDANSSFGGGGHNAGDRYRGKKPGRFSVSTFETVTYV